MKKILKHFIKKSLLIIITVLTVYFFNQILGEENRGRIASRDTGFETVFLLYFTIVFLFIFFAFDVFKQYQEKEKGLLIISCLFLILIIISLFNFWGFLKLI